MQRASIAHLKDSLLISRAREKLGMRYALGKGGLVHTKVGTRSLCGAWSSVKRYGLRTKRCRACKTCRTLAKEKIKSALANEVRLYWDNPAYCKTSKIVEQINFGLFEEEK